MNLENNDIAETNGFKEKIQLNKVKFWDFDWMFDVENFVEQPLGFTFEGVSYPEGTEKDDSGSISSGHFLAANYGGSFGPRRTQVAVT